MRIRATLAVLATLLSVQGAMAQNAPSFKEIVEGAKKEGKLTAWIFVPAKPETHRAVIDAFNKRFDLNIEVEWVPNHPVTSIQRVIGEATSGDVTVDVLGGGSAQETKTALQAGIISPYPWSTVFGDEMPRIKDLEEPVFANAKGISLRYYEALWGIAWNPNSIADADVPDTYTAFTDPKWSGKFGVNAFFAPHDSFVSVIGYDETITLAKKIIENKPIFARGSAALAQDILNGVSSFGMILTNQAEFFMSQNQPMKFKLAKDYVPAVYAQLLVPDKAPHPNAARLFAAWFAAEGYKVAAQFEPISGASDPDSRTSKMTADAIANGAKLATFRTEEDISLSEKARAEITSLVSGQK